MMIYEAQKKTTTDNYFNRTITSHLILYNIQLFTTKGKRKRHGFPRKHFFPELYERHGTAFRRPIRSFVLKKQQGATRLFANPLRLFSSRWIFRLPPNSHAKPEELKTPSHVSNPRRYDAGIPYLGIRSKNRTQVPVAALFKAQFEF